MSKVLDWSQTYKSPVGDIRQGKGATSKYGSMKEGFNKAYAQMEEQEKAQAVLKKAMPVMQNILLQRMVEKRPIKIVRPLPYTCETLNNGDTEEDDDGFYAIKKSEKFNASFKSITKVIQPGTVLTFMTLEKSMNQMWFRTDKGEEVGIYVEEQSRILTSSDIYELVSQNMTE